MTLPAIKVLLGSGNVAPQEITFPIAGVTNTYSFSASPSFTLGESPIEGDLLVAFASVTVSTSAFDTAGAWATDWSYTWPGRIVATSSTNSAAMIYHRVTAAEDAANKVTWTLTDLWDGAATGRISVAVLRGVSSYGAPFLTTSAFSDSTVDGTIPTITPTADCVVIAGFSQDGATGRTSEPTGYTDIAGGNATQHCYIYRRTANGENGVATGSAAANTSTNDQYVSQVACFATPADLPPTIEMVSPSFQSGTYSATASPVITRNGNVPKENDIVVVFVSSTTSATAQAVSGWTQVEATSVGAMAAVMVYHRVSAAEEAASTLSWTLTDLWDAATTGSYTSCCLRGVATTGELVGSAAESFGFALDGSIPTVTPTADCAVIAGFAQDGTGGKTSDPDDYTVVTGSTATQHNYMYRRTLDGESGVATGSAPANTATNDEYSSIVAAFKFA